MPQKKRGRGKANKEPALPPIRAPSPSSDIEDVQCRSRSGSTASSVASNAVPAAPEVTTENSPSSEAPKKKRARKTACALDAEEEQSMVEFLQENPMLWDIKRTDYRRTDKKVPLWENQAEKMGKTVDYLKGWFKSLRDSFTRLDKKKSGDGAPELTERERWIKDNFRFLLTVTRHRPEPINSVKAAIAANPGDLEAAEAGCEELHVTDVEETNQTSLTDAGRRDKKVKNDDILQSLQKRLQQSGELLKDLAEPKIINERTAFANYVRDSLLTMNKTKFRKVKSNINKILTQVMDECSDDEDAQNTLPTLAPSISNRVRPLSAASFSSSPSVMYQPPPHMWRFKPPQGSVWASATPEYVEQYMQQPPQHQESSMVPTPPPATPQQQKTQQSSTPLSEALGSVSQVLNQSPVLDISPGLSSIINMSTDGLDGRNTLFTA